MIFSDARCSESKQATDRFRFTPGRFLDGNFATISSWHWDNYVGF
jgi:hypothetical protein